MRGRRPMVADRLACHAEAGNLAHGCLDFAKNDALQSLDPGTNVPL